MIIPGFGGKDGKKKSIFSRIKKGIDFFRGLCTKRTNSGLQRREQEVKKKPVTIEDIYNELKNIYEKNGIPWNNSLFLLNLENYIKKRGLEEILKCNSKDNIIKIIKVFDEIEKYVPAPNISRINNNLKSSKDIELFIHSIGPYISSYDFDKKVLTDNLDEGLNQLIIAAYRKSIEDTKKFLQSYIKRLRESKDIEVENLTVKQLKEHIKNEIEYLNEKLSQT